MSGLTDTPRVHIGYNVARRVAASKERYQEHREYSVLNESDCPDQRLPQP